MTVADINGCELQQYLIHDGELFTLALATDDELFYIDENEEKVIDISRTGKTILSDNYFAIESFQNALDEDENITYTLS